LIFIYYLLPFQNKFKYLPQKLLFFVLETNRNLEKLRVAHRHEFLMRIWKKNCWDSKNELYKKIKNKIKKYIFCKAIIYTPGGRSQSVKKWSLEIEVKVSAQCVRLHYISLHSFVAIPDKSLVGHVVLIQTTILYTGRKSFRCNWIICRNLMICRMTSAAHAYFVVIYLHPS